MGKLLPLTQGNSVIYKFYPGHFLKILGLAYKGLMEGKDVNYLLVIDELNRGNSSAIFGTIFQLLDREMDGWSSYVVDISDMELVGLLKSMGYKASFNDQANLKVSNGRVDKDLDTFCADEIECCDDLGRDDVIRVMDLIAQRKISIPRNLSILATINTSDESIYYLDSAFKRRWDWEYFEAPDNKTSFSDIPDKIKDVELLLNPNYDTLRWVDCVIGINSIMLSHCKTVKRIEDKLIGWWFVQPEEDGYIHMSKVESKLLFFLWDGVFNRDKKTLAKIVTEASGKQDLVEIFTFSHFLAYGYSLLKYASDIGREQLFEY